MRRIWADRLVRVGGVVALLGLLAVGEKICPRLIGKGAGGKARYAANSDNLPVKPVSSRLPAYPASDRSPPTDGGQPGHKAPQPVPLTLATALPDAVPVRWPGLPTRASLEETAGWRSGTFALGPLNPLKNHEASSANALTADWPSGVSALDAFVCITPRTEARPIRDPSVTTTLLRTGPPRS